MQSLLVCVFTYNNNLAGQIKKREEMDEVPISLPIFWRENSTQLRKVWQNKKVYSVLQYLLCISLFFSIKQVNNYFSSEKY